MPSTTNNTNTNTNTNEEKDDGNVIRISVMVYLPFDVMILLLYPVIQQRFPHMYQIHRIPIPNRRRHHHHPNNDMDENENDNNDTNNDRKSLPILDALDDMEITMYQQQQQQQQSSE